MCNIDRTGRSIKLIALELCCGERFTVWSAISRVVITIIHDAR